MARKSPRSAWRNARAMEELVAYSERRVRAGIAALPDGRYEAMDVLETDDSIMWH